MIREEAIIHLRWLYAHLQTSPAISARDYRTAVKLAIEALQQVEELQAEIDMLNWVTEKLSQERPKGRWIELPCEIGDTVWLVPKYLGNPLGIIRKDKVQMIGVTSRGIHLKLREYHDHNKMYMLGKTVFLTKEEAEKALADMREEQE